MFESSVVFDVISLLISVIALLISITLHEVAHGYASYKLGDSTAKANNRLSLNPFDHINPSAFLLLIIIMAIGVFTGGGNNGFVMSIMSVMVCFTFATPVPVNTRGLKDPLKDMALIAVAGPVTNIAVAFVGMIIIKYFSLVFSPIVNSEFAFYLWYFAIYFFSYVVQLNIGLAVFNLLPIPPLDGSKILYRFLPRNALITFVKYERYITMALLLLLVFDVLDRPLNIIGDAVYSGLEFVVNLLPPRG